MLRRCRNPWIAPFGMYACVASLNRCLYCSIAHLIKEIKQIKKRRNTICHVCFSNSNYLVMLTEEYNDITF